MEKYEITDKEREALKSTALEIGEETCEAVRRLGEAMRDVIPWINSEKRKNYWKMQWAVNEYRKDRRTGAISPVKGSRYFEELSKLGAGWSK